MWCRLPAVALTLSIALSGCFTASPRPEPSPTASPEPALRVSGSGTALPLIQKLIETYAEEHPKGRLELDTGTNSGGAIRGVLAGTLDLAVASRGLSEAEAREALEYRPFARDAVVFAVHLPNPLRGLTSPQLRDIYGGSVTDWGQVGGLPGPIIVLDRDEDESARRLVLVPLMDGRPVQSRSVTLTTARDMVRALESTASSLGYSSLGLLAIMKPRDVQTLALDGVTPDAESLARGDYPWQLTFGLVHRHDPPPAVHRFVQFATGPAARRVLDAHGYAAPER